MILVHSLALEVAVPFLGVLDSSLMNLDLRGEDLDARVPVGDHCRYEEEEAYKSSRSQGRLL